MTNTDHETETTPHDHHAFPEPLPTAQRFTHDEEHLAPHDLDHLCEQFLQAVRQPFYTRLLTAIGPLCLLSRERDETTFLQVAIALLGILPLREDDDDEENRPVKMLRLIQ